MNNKITPTISSLMENQDKDFWTQFERLFIGCADSGNVSEPNWRGKFKSPIIYTLKKRISLKDFSSHLLIRL